MTCNGLPFPKFLDDHFLKKIAFKTFRKPARMVTKGLPDMKLSYGYVTSEPFKSEWKKSWLSSLINLVCFIKKKGPIKYKFRLCFKIYALLFS